MVEMVDDDLLASDVLEFADEADQVSSENLGFWKVLIVDDENEIHQITRLALDDFVFDNKKLTFLSAYSGLDARQVLRENPDIAVVLLDVIMETEDAGLALVKHIRETSQNRAVRIVLRTGQPGQVPERQVIVDYDIDDYKTKTELTSQKLFTTVITALRSFKAYTALESYAVLESLNADLARTNQELLRVAQLKDEFLATMSHEFRTPLNSIMGMSEIMTEGIFGAISQEQRQALHTIKSGGEHLLELINDILDASKIMAGMLKLEIAPVAIAHLCDASLDFVKQLALQKKIQILTNLAPNLDAIVVDERRLKQVLVNLLCNAVKFTPEGGKVDLDVSIETSHRNQIPPLENSHNPTMETSKSGVWIKFSVSDNGIGIAPEDQPKLFQPFIQLDSGLNRRYEGSGLGLAIAKQLVELHGGYIDLSSEVGQGSCFAVYLPY
jgi:signal transduction histidine kinase